MLEVPNLQFVETRYYFDGQWRIGSRLREKDDELLEVGKVYANSIINNKITCLDNFDLSGLRSNGMWHRVGMSQPKY